MKTLSLFSLVLVSTVSTFAATISIPSTTVNGTDVFSGPTFTLTSAVAPTDTLTLTATGQVFLQGNGIFGTNAAGVLTTAGSSPVGATLANGSTSFGSLLLGNSSLGFKQIFPANAANGLGSATPPSTLSVIALSFSSLGFNSTLPVGTILEFRISDSNTGDNFGSFTASGSINTASVSGVPEPGSLSMIFLGLVALGGLRYRRR